MTESKETQAKEPFGDFSKMLEQFKLPGIDMASLVEARRSDIAALTEANKVAYEGMKELARKQIEILRVTMEEMQLLAEEMVEGGKPEALAGKPKEVIEQAVQKALANMRELAEMAVKSQTEAFTIISNRGLQAIEEMKKLSRPK